MDLVPRNDNYACAYTPTRTQPEKFITVTKQPFTFRAGGHAKAKVRWLDNPNDKDTAQKQ